MLCRVLCRACNGHGMIGGHSGQTAESYEEHSEECPDCKGALFEEAEVSPEAYYQTFRGKCKRYCEAELQLDPTLTLVRGHIFVAAWPSEPDQAHWWCRRADGTILDPTWRQFPFIEAPPPELYTEFDGRVTCAECGKEMDEKDARTESNYAFCSSRCYGRFVGL